MKGKFITTFTDGIEVSVPCQFDFVTGQITILNSVPEVLNYFSSRHTLVCERVAAKCDEGETEYIDVCPECHEYLLRLNRKTNTSECPWCSCNRGGLR